MDLPLTMKTVEKQWVLTQALLQWPSSLLAEFLAHWKQLVWKVEHNLRHEEVVSSEVKKVWKALVQELALLTQRLHHQVSFVPDQKAGSEGHFAHVHTDRLSRLCASCDTHFGIQDSKPRT